MLIYGGTAWQVDKQRKCPHKWHGPCIDRVSRYYKCLSCYALKRDIQGSTKEYWEALNQSPDKGEIQECAPGWEHNEARETCTCADCGTVYYFYCKKCGKQECIHCGDTMVELCRKCRALADDLKMVGGLAGDTSDATAEVKTPKADHWLGQLLDLIELLGNPGTTELHNLLNQLSTLGGLIKTAMENEAGAPFRGVCPHCTGAVFHAYPWFRKGKPYHDECAKVLFTEEA